MKDKSQKGTTVVVGGDGLIGSRIKPLLLKEGKEFISLRGILPGQKDLIPKDADEVIFLAQSSDIRNTGMSEDTFFVNTALLVQVLKESVDAGVARFSYCSTGSVYAPSNGQHNEEDALLSDNLSPYLATKLASEILIKSWVPFLKRLVIFRPFFCYGPGQNADRLIPNMFRRVIRGEEIYLHNIKGLVFNPIHADDAAYFILQALRIKEGFDIYNIAGSEIVTLFDIVSQIALLVKSNPNFTYLDGEQEVIIGEIKKMKSTGFKHNIDIKAGLQYMHKSFLNRISKN